MSRVWCIFPNGGSSCLAKATARWQGNFPGIGHILNGFALDGSIYSGRFAQYFETVISVENSNRELRIPNEAEDLDQLNYIAGKRISEVNHKAELGTILAHVDGGVPNIRIIIPEISAKVLGELIYFFEMSCALSGYTLGVNPFNQPGVEAYKKNMFALLGKKGYESQTEALKKRLEL